MNAPILAGASLLWDFTYLVCRDYEVSPNGINPLNAVNDCGGSLRVRFLCTLHIIQFSKSLTRTAPLLRWCTAFRGSHPIGAMVGALTCGWDAPPQVGRRRETRERVFSYTHILPYPSTW